MESWGFRALLCIFSQVNQFMHSLLLAVYNHSSRISVPLLKWVWLEESVLTGVR